MNPAGKVHLKQQLLWLESEQFVTAITARQHIALKAFQRRAVRSGPPYKWHDCCKHKQMFGSK